MKRNNLLKRSWLILPLVFGLLFFWFFSGQKQVLAQTATLVATVKVNPLEIEVTTLSNVTVGQWFTITVKVSNRGSETIRKTVASLNTPTEIVVRGKNKKLGDLEPGETKIVSWQAKANSSGNFVILAEVTGTLAGEQISTSDTAMISANFITSRSLVSLFRRFIFGS